MGLPVLVVLFIVVLNLLFYKTAWITLPILTSVMLLFLWAVYGKRRS